MSTLPMTRIKLPAARLQNWWLQHTPRDRRVLLGLALGALLLLAYVWLWRPAAEGIARLERDLPAQRAQRTEVMAMAEEARVLRQEAARNAAAVLPAEARRAALERSIATTGVSGAQIVDEGGQRVRVRWPRIDYGIWVAWSAAAERELGARVTQVYVMSLAAPVQGAPATAPVGPPGLVRAEIVFEWRVP